MKAGAANRKNGATYQPITRPQTARAGSAAGPPSREEEGSSGSPSLGSCLGAMDPATQPLEPILFPKVRIYYADFLDLHFSID